MKIKSFKIILIISLVVAIIFLGGIVLKNNPNVSYGECCSTISPEQDPDYNCSCNEIGCLCFNEKLNESCACVDGGCICN